jgi:hypothetical protein
MPMEYPEPFLPAKTSRPAGPEFRAMQADTAITCVDWQAFHSWQDGDPTFTGVITVLGQDGSQHGTANWPSPTDAAADSALGCIGWQRVGPWNSDHDGRRSAPLRTPRPPHPLAWVPATGGRNEDVNAFVAVLDPRELTGR